MILCRMYSTEEIDEHSLQYVKKKKKKIGKRWTAKWRGTTVFQNMENTVLFAAPESISLHYIVRRGQYYGSGQRLPHWGWDTVWEWPLPSMRAAVASAERLYQRPKSGSGVLTSLGCCPCQTDQQNRFGWHVTNAGWCHLTAGRPAWGGGARLMVAFGFFHTVQPSIHWQNMLFDIVHRQCKYSVHMQSTYRVNALSQDVLLDIP